MNNPSIFCGNFSAVRIENTGAEVIRQDGAFKIVESRKGTEFFIPPEYTNIKFRNGNKFLEEEKSFYSDFIQRKHFRYNEKNKLSEIEIEDYKTYKYIYNSLGQLVKKERDQGATASYNNQYYYSRGVLIREEWRSYNYAEIDWTYEYDSAGNNLHKIGYYLRGQVAVAYELNQEFDSNNRLKKLYEERNKDYHGTERKEVLIEYDSDDRIIKKVTDNFDKFLPGLFEEKFRYDQFGNVVSYIKTKSGDSWEKKSYEYQFDSNSNWIYCIEFDDDIPIRISKRSFER